MISAQHAPTHYRPMRKGGRTKDLEYGEVEGKGGIYDHS